MKSNIASEILFVFPGQGSQFIGMGRELYSTNALVREVFEEANDALSMDLKSVIFDSSDEILTLTENAQPAILCVSIAIFRVLESLLGKDAIKDSVKYFAGHSLGEYTALCANGILSFYDAIRLVRKRGKFMKHAMKDKKGKMAAILFTDILSVDNFINDNKIENCYVANDNGAGQIIISGLDISIDEFINISNNTKKFKRIIPLNVSSAFHSPYMKSIKDDIKSILEEVTFHSSSVSIISNVTATAEDDISIIKSLLIDQIYSKVRWRESIQYAFDKGVREFIEIGPGKVLSTLISKILKDYCNNEDIRVSNIFHEKEVLSFKEKFCTI
ncbi:ACP S-malonyltransferase [Anaplasmataceae bacterium AB001_6]|nr:ACP S-malonyltransferase [Anaplasmataceae bacterium AB001_6]